MLKFLMTGGVLLVPILALSVAALAVIIEKAVQFSRLRESEEDLAMQVVERLKREKPGEVASELRRRGTPVAVVLAAGVGGGEIDTARREARMLAQATRVMVDLESHVSYLSSIATIATLLGLLGTVSGMIISFMNMRSSGVSDPAVLAGGISQALITTAAGLSVAIPSLLAYHVFVHLTGRSASRMEIAAAELTAYYGADSGKGGSDGGTVRRRAGSRGAAGTTDGRGTTRAGSRKTAGSAATEPSTARTGRTRVRGGGGSRSRRTNAAGEGT